MLARLLTILVSAYGVKLSRTATQNIVDVQINARAGDAESRRHFTQTRYARVLGPHNSDLGLIYYSALLFAATTGLIRRRPIARLFRIASTASLVMSLYLLWALVFRLRVRCPICLKGHAVNVILWILLRRD